MGAFSCGWAACAAASRACVLFFFFQAEDGIRDLTVTGVQTCALPIYAPAFHEGFSDIVALLQHFSFKDSLLETIQRTGGLIHRKQLAPTVAPERGGQIGRASCRERV